MREIMREKMIEIFDNIEWAVVAGAMLAFVGFALVFVSILFAILYENAWLLLILLPAGACLSLSFGIHTSGF